ncbi:hypothetical protein DEJ21_07700 [Curtobacterium sp. MCSS17_006]|uniref:AAA family ATPase n=1 Tax=Curtobacterium sp. MCSS17_006 TaxID=2175642 RepID=UPI000DA9BB17|nr:AAA family ATPase [Curtobacterium sp. MCSS17_006]PZE36761.1 hypothetical protein DEJ21_07700 [Curtobacterium sp. MCSS17_006]
MATPTFNFLVRSKSSWAPDRLAPFDVYLRADDWDDYGYRTTFFVSVHDPATASTREIGTLKVADLSTPVRPTLMSKVTTVLPSEFHTLPPEFGSLAQDPSFYSEVMRIYGQRQGTELARALRDLSLDPDRFAMNNDPTGPVEKSFLRFVTRSIVKTQFSRILAGEEEARAFELHYSPRGTTNQAIDLHVDPESPIPTNIHALIGTNGAGKSTILFDMENEIRDFTQGEARTESFSGSTLDSITTLVTVRFSAFDANSRKLVARTEEPANLRIVNIALAQPESREYLPPLVSERADTPTSADLPIPSTPEGQEDYFHKTVAACILDRTDALIRAMETLARADRQLNRKGISDPQELRALDFSSLSSGHKVVLLSTVSLVRYCEERTLVLVDEPESHLHPPLLSAFVRVVAEILKARNSVALVVTHSPIVLQEIPKNSAWIINQIGHRSVLTKPTIETFGESVDVLTREVFGLELREAGYYTILAEVASKFDSFPDAESHFQHQLGGEARMILRAMIDSRLDV